MKKTILSGIKPSGIPHLGNYLGAIIRWKENQDKYNNLFFIADLHAITVPQNPKELKNNTYLTASILLAAGIDHKKSIIFIQSHVPAHSELAWLLITIAKMGELFRMTQFKDQTNKAENKESIGLGLFSYPVLMTGDILLYQADVIPVGEDQKQHVELVRDLAQRFNHRYGKTFVIPEPVIKKEGARIMSLDDPDKKMSKSDKNNKSYILITDKPEIIRKKIMRAVTDSGKTIKFDTKRKGLYNLLIIYKIFSGKTESQIEKYFKNKGYGDFKKELADLVITKLSPIQAKISYYMKNKKLLDKILADGARKANKIANKTLAEARQKIGLVEISPR